MKWPLFIFLFLNAALSAQETMPIAEQQMETLADKELSETENDDYWQELEQFRRSPLNLNSATSEELLQLGLLDDIQVSHLIKYRELMGALIDIHEMQALPGWDLYTICRLLPFVTVTEPLSLKQTLRERLQGGEHSFLFRVSQVTGVQQDPNYQGSPQRFFFRYQYVYKQLLKFGITADKDAGEPFFKNAQRYGFDFYSAHLYIGKIGIVQSMVVGDFTVSMGQGLLLWQGGAFGKGGEALAMEKQSPIIRAYHSGGEFNFYRGVAITVKKRRVESNIFLSSKKLSGNIVKDPVDNKEYISSLQTSGYHRTAAELADRNNFRQIAAGTSINYKIPGGRVGINGVYHNFSLPIKKQDEPYNLFAWGGINWYNISVDYKYSYRNIHLFGEIAIDKNLHKGLLHGCMISADSKLDIGILYRRIAPQYQTINGSAFTENTSPTNEEGFYIGISFKPSIAWKLEAYTDVYHFPWLRYNVDAPSFGRDYLAQLTYVPNKQVEIYTRFRNTAKQRNKQEDGQPLASQQLLPVINWRLQINYTLNQQLVLRQRVEMLWYDRASANSETGFLVYADFLYKSVRARVNASIRLQYFATESYNSRLYAYENDVLFSYSLPAFYDEGYRYYLTLKWTGLKKISLGLRWAQLIYPVGHIIGSTANAFDGRRKGEWKTQFIWSI